MSRNVAETGVWTSPAGIGKGYAPGGAPDSGLPDKMTLPPTFRRPSGAVRRALALRRFGVSVEGPDHPAQPFGVLAAHLDRPHAELDGEHTGGAAQRSRPHRQLAFRLAADGNQLRAER